MKLKIVCKIFRDTLLQISRHRIKSFMTLFSIAIATLTILLIVSSNSFLNQNLEEQLGSDSQIKVIYKPENATTYEGFTASDVALIKSVKGVEQVSPHAEGLSRQLPIKLGEQIVQKTVRSLAEVNQNIDLAIINGEKNSMIKGELSNAVISDELAHQISNGKSSSEVLGQKITIKDEEVTVVGIYYTTSDTNLFPDIVISGKLLEKIQPQADDNLVIETSSNNQSDLMYTILNLLNSQGSNREVGRYDAINNEKVLEEAKGNAKAGQFMFVMIGSVSLFVAGFGVMNALYASISERSKEISIRRALGASKFEVQLAIQIEGTLLTVIGGIIGVSIALLFSLIGQASNVPIELSSSNILLTFGITIIIGLLFSYLPAVKASTQNVIEGLHD